MTEIRFEESRHKDVNAKYLSGKDMVDSFLNLAKKNVDTLLELCNGLSDNKNTTNRDWLTAEILRLLEELKSYTPAINNRASALKSATSRLKNAKKIRGDNIVPNQTYMQNLGINFVDEINKINKSFAEYLSSTATAKKQRRPIYFSEISNNSEPKGIVDCILRLKRIKMMLNLFDVISNKLSEFN
jgi:hypothetical protein